MLRITSSRGEGITRVKLEGRLVGPWVAECRARCAEEAAGGQGIALDLTDVCYADPAGVELLRELADRGQVERTSSFARELLRDEREDLVRRHAGELLATARAFLADDTAALAATGAAFRAALRAPRACAHEAERAAWLRGFVVAACLARMEGLRSGEGSDAGEAIEGLLPDFDPVGAHVQPLAPGPRGAGAELPEVRRRIDELPPSHRAVLLLADREGLAPREIAAHLAIPEAEARARLHRARQALLTLLAPAARPSSACRTSA
jgi:RNA polymerase sigma-70 factor (ECF subfamily)